MHREDTITAYLPQSKDTRYAMDPLRKETAVNTTKRSNHNGKKLLLSFYVMLILFALITTASYTWFSLSRTPRVSDMNLYVNAAPRLELSLDPAAEEWTLQLDLQDMMPASTPLRPITWVEEERCFYGAAYGLDGRLLDFSRWQKLSDERNANKDNLDGYYIKLEFYARATSDVKVSLSPAVEVDQGIYGAGTYVIGQPQWNAESLTHDNAGLGAENAVRFGIRVIPVDPSGIPTGEKESFFIYEPNCDSHIDGSAGYVNTPSITGAEHLTASEYIIRQTQSTWTESFPVERDVVVKTLGQFQDDTFLFQLQTDEMVKLEIYIWLEGQDVDCIAQIREAQILACIQFDADPIGGSGLIPIE